MLGGATGGGTAVGLKNGGGALAGAAWAASPSPFESARAGGGTDPPARWSPVAVLSNSLFSVTAGFGGAWRESALAAPGASRGGVAGVAIAENPDDPFDVEAIIAGAEVRRLRMTEGSMDLGLEFFLLAFRSSLCFLRYSCRSFLEMPSSTSGPVVLPGGAF